MDASGRQPDEGEDMERDGARSDPDREARWARWRQENAGAIADYNRWFEAEGHRFLRRPRF